MKTQSRINYIKFTGIGFVYCLFLLLIHQNTGIVTIHEAEKYIAATKELLKGNITYTFNHHLFYSSYVFFITPFLAAGGAIGVVIAQALLNFIAAIAVKKTIDLIIPGNRISILGMLTYLFSYAIQYWTLTLFSDNFFVALIAIGLYYTLKQKTKIELLAWVSLLLLLVFARPPGVFLTAVFSFYYLFEKKIASDLLLRILAGVVLISLFLALFYLPVETKGYIKPIAAGCIIVDKPDYDIPAFNLLEKSTLADAYAYLVKQNGLLKTTVLYIRKFGSFFTLTRPYYSTLNNSILALHYALYLLAFIGLSGLKRQKHLLILFLAAIFFVGNLTALTYNEWHYRFTLAIFPFLIVLSVQGIYSILRAIKPKPSN